MFQIERSQYEISGTLKIIEDTGSQERSLLRLTRNCRNPDIILIATIDDVAVGVISTRKPDQLTGEVDSRGYLDGIFINEKYKNLGIEKMLFSELIQKVKAQSKTHLCVIAEAPPTVTDFEDIEEIVEKQEIDFSFFYNFHNSSKMPMKIVTTKIVSRKYHNYIQFKL